MMARDAHEGQTRKYTGRPYIEHPARVAARVAIVQGASPEMVAAAFLHDVLEDTDVSLEEIELFSPEAAELVVWLTNPSKGSHLPRAERKRMDREHIVSAPWEARVIKLLDRIDNLREMEGAPTGFARLYGQESLLLAEALEGTDPILEAELIEISRRLVES